MNHAVMLAGALIFSGSDYLPTADVPPGGLPKCDTYYAIVFGAQRPLVKNPRHTHTWATFVHLRPDGSAEEFTISWLPETGRVRPFALHPEKGRNYTLPETIDFCRETGIEMIAYGPYQIDPELWEIASAQCSLFESGAVLYKAMDMGARQMRMSNCVHAVSSMMRDPGQRAPYVKTAAANWGESGTFWTALTLRPHFIHPCCLHLWLMPRIGLCPGDFSRGHLDRNPTRNPITRAAQALLQSYLLPNRVNCPR